MAWASQWTTYDADEGTLYHFSVGRLDGRTFHVLDPPSNPAESSVYGGRVLVAWEEAGRSVVASIDTGNGAVTELARLDLEVDDVEFGLDGDVYLLSWDGSRSRVLRMEGNGHTEQVGEPIDFSLYFTASTDHSRLAIETFAHDNLYRYRVIDTRRHTMVAIPGPPLGDIAGIFGDDLLVFTDAFSDTIDLPRPVTAIAMDGSRRELVADSQVWSTVFPDIDLTPILVFDSLTDDGRNAISILHLGESQPTLVYATDAHWWDLGFPIRGRGISTPGWIPMLTGRSPYEQDPQNQLHRLLIPINGGDPVDIGPEPIDSR
ncbi:MAG: hypothetical protein ABIZ34_10590 [Candidatus Limnocylindrales bacterium]